MNTYHDKLEDLLLTKDYDALTPAERSYVADTLGNADAYSSERVLRLRSRAVLASETAPADAAGLTAVMERTRPRRAVVIPIWQTAAAVILAALLAWWGRGILNTSGTSEEGLLATVDTVYQEVKVLDTVFLPTPKAEENPLAVEERNAPKRKGPGARKAPGSRRDFVAGGTPDPDRKDLVSNDTQPPKNNDSDSQNGSDQVGAVTNPDAAAKLAEAIAILPEPNVTERSGGSQPSANFPPDEMESYSDKFSIQY